MRASILIWSAASGVVVGLLAGATLLAIGIIAAALIPGLGAKLGGRMLTVWLVVLFVVLPAVGAVFGFLEGRLKAD